jgi:hypothetical protein
MTDSDERRRMALQINSNIGTPATSGDVNAQPTTSPNGAPNQDTANQLADLLKNPAEEAGKPALAPSPFGTPAKSETKGNPAGSAEQGSSTAQASTSQGAKEGTAANTASPFAAQAKPENNASSSANLTFASSAAVNTPISNDAGGLAQASAASTANTASSATTATTSQTASPSMTAKTEAAPTGASVPQSVATSASASAMPTNSMSANTAGVGAPVQAQLQPGITGEIKESAKSGVEGLSDTQLAAAASMNAAVGLQPAGATAASTGVEEVAQPHVDGEKIEAMMRSVTKELGMRDLSNLKLGGEMTLKLDQGALPNTEVKVRFEGNEMVISIDSKTADVNKFCTDNLSLLQQSVSSGMKEDMKVRIEVPNPPDQPNQRKDDESGQGGQSGGGQRGNQGNSQQQPQSSEGDSLAS